MIGRFLLGALGAAMLLWGIAMPTVTLFGEETSAEITTVRRQLGDQGGVIPNRYVFSISYRFELPSGASVDGYTQRLGDFSSPKSLEKPGKVRVRYLPAFPWLNTIDRGWGMVFEYLVVAAVGVVLIHFSRKKVSAKRRRIPKRRATSEGMDRRS